MTGRIIAVCRSADHRFAKQPCDGILLVAGLGVEGDAHHGSTVQHRSRLNRTPGAPNLRQVHLLHSELFSQLAQAGYDVAVGAMGENLTTVGIDLLGLGRGTRLRIGKRAVIEITGLRNPCRQIDEHIGRGAMAATLATAKDGSLVRLAGVMAIVVAGGVVRPGDEIAIVEVPPISQPLQTV